METTGCRDLRVIPIAQYRPKLGQAALLLLQFHHSEARIVEHDELDGQLVRSVSDQISHEHREATITAKGDHLAMRVLLRCAERLWHRIRHRTEIKRSH